MKTIEYHTVDKSSWRRGEWDHEPDKMQFADASTGLPCLIVRGPLGALCGYVGVTEGHPFFGKHYDHCVFPERHRSEVDEGVDGYHYACTPGAAIEVHGGITFSDFCAEARDKSRHICHVPDAGEPAHVWWLGFDCGHYKDLAPGIRMNIFMDGDYRTIAYVRRQCARLAEQLAALADARTGK